MGLTLGERRAVTQAAAIRYQQASKRGKSRILDELCANTGWHRSHARKALKAALVPTIVAVRGPRPVMYGPEVIAALTVCWTVLGMPAGKRLAPMLAELVAVLRHFRELVISDETAALLVSMSAATIDRRLADERAKYTIRGRVGTKPGSLLKSQIPVRTWAEWDDAVPGFVEIDTVFHDGGNRGGGHAFTLTVTDIATGWTESRSLPDRTARTRTGRPQSHRRRDAVPDRRRGLRQRIGIHQRRPAPMVPRPPYHLHSVPAGQQERRLPRRAEELDRGTHSGRLLPLRHRVRTGCYSTKSGTSSRN